MTTVYVLYNFSKFSWFRVCFCYFRSWFGVAVRFFSFCFFLLLRPLCCSAVSVLLRLCRSTAPLVHRNILDHTLFSNFDSGAIGPWHWRIFNFDDLSAAMASVPICQFVLSVRNFSTYRQLCDFFVFLICHHKGSLGTLTPGQDFHITKHKTRHRKRLPGTDHIGDVPLARARV